jgi:transcriptional regulator with XRE-family HTH domain
MKLEEILGIDFNDPDDRLAHDLVREDQSMLDALIQVRERSGKTQSQIAELMGVSPSAVSRIESGERDPHLSTLRRYALAVGAVVRHDVRSFDEVERRRQVVAAMGHVREFPWATRQNLASSVGAAK